MTMPEGTAPDPTGEVSDTGRLHFIGTATTIITYGPFTLLTDPNFLHQGQRAYLGRGLVSRRLTEPALDASSLPVLDAVLLSHLHGDHWDRVARRQLDRSVPILTTPHAARRLQGWYGFRRATGLQTWEDYQLTKGDRVLRVTSMPGRHMLGPIRRLLPPVMGSLLEFGRQAGPFFEPDYRLYITGDTLMYDGLREITSRFGPADLAVLHLGGTTLPGGMVVTMDARQGADLLEALRPRRAVPVHYDDYPLFKSPLSDFRSEVQRRGLDQLVTWVDRGGSVALGPAEIRPASSPTSGEAVGGSAAPPPRLSPSD